MTAGKVPAESAMQSKKENAGAKPLRKTKAAY